MKKDGPVWALGTMSGTSLDGVDAALVRTDGEAILDLGATAYRPYSAAEQGAVRAALGRWPGDPGVAEAAEVVETAHAELLSGLLARHDADLVGFPGQTLAHDPSGRGTHQAGDGAVMAQVLGCPVVWDFRSADVALGGQGAPLAPFYHHACARFVKADAPLAVLTLGGLGALTWVDPNAPLESCFAFQTGPANALLDDMIRERLGQPYDRGGALASEGEADLARVTEILTRPYFRQVPPKSLDRNAFSDVLPDLKELSPADAAATLVTLVAASVADGMERLPGQAEALWVAGGGRRNAAIMRALSAGMSCPVLPVEQVGLNGDMLQAQAFAFLAVRVARGLSTSAPGTTGVAAPIGGGVVSGPSVFPGALDA